MAKQGRRHTSPGALQSIEWGHISEAEYLREEARMKELRGELLATTPAPAIQLRGLLDAWQLGDGVTRRELLAALFDHLHVSEGKIVGYTAR